MILTTPGLVLHTTNYSESSVIVKIFTRQLGVRSYILKGVRGAKSRTKQNLLQPLSHVDLSVYDSSRSTINYVKDIHPARQYPNTAADSARITLIFFMNELLYKVLRESDPQPEVFDYVVEELVAIDSGRVRLSHQPLLFMLRMSRLLGIEPMNNYSLKEPLFDFSEGRFVQEPGMLDNKHGHMLLTTQESLQLHYLMVAFGQGSEVPRVDGHGLLMALLGYFGHHISECRDFKSVEVLHGLLG